MPLKRVEIKNFKSLKNNVFDITNLNWYNSFLKKIEKMGTRYEDNIKLENIYINMKERVHRIYE